MPESLTLHEQLFVDHLIMFLRDHYPARWETLVKTMPAQKRLHLFCRIGCELLDLAERRFHEKDD